MELGKIDRCRGAISVFSATGKLQAKKIKNGHKVAKIN